jgi:hypothetical protein
LASNMSIKFQWYLIRIVMVSKWFLNMITIAECVSVEISVKKRI